MGFISNELLPTLSGVVLKCPICGSVLQWEENTCSFSCPTCYTTVKLPLSTIGKYLMK